ncbi:MAG: glycosyltransferase 87 family protein [Planctomycetota bacterium]
MIEPDDPLPSARLSALQIALLLGLVLAGRLFALYALPLYDDAFITLRYARNLADGAGMVFNPGAAWEPVLGTTTPGFTVLVALLLKLGGEPTATVLVLGIVLDLVSAGSIVALFRRRLVPTTVALVVFAVLPQIARIGVGGMESPLLVALLLAGALAARARRVWLTGLAVALACVVRPEAVLFTVIFGLSFVRDRRALLRYAAVIAVVGFVSASLLTLFYGSPIPQSVQAKSSTHAAADAAAGFERMLEIARQAFLPTLWLAPLLPVVVIGLLRSFRRRDGVHLVGAAALAVVISYLIARPHTWGWYYYLPLVAWSLWLGSGVEALVERFGCVNRAALERRVRFALPVIVAGAAVASSLVIWPRPDLVTQHVYRPLEHFVRANGIDGADRILASDIGAIAYYSNCIVLDSEGLTWPAALDFKGDGPGMTNAQIEILDAERPEWVIFVAERPRIAAFRSRPELVAAYEPVARFNVENDRELEPALDDLPPHWMQDYLVYRRR